MDNHEGASCCGVVLEVARLNQDRLAFQSPSVPGGVVWFWVCSLSLAGFKADTTG